jgi:hypothetical protein
VLGSAGLFGGKGQLFLLRQGVDAGGFAGVGPPHKGNFWHIKGGQVKKFSGGG